MPIFQPEVETLPRPELERLQRERLQERFGVELEALPEQPFRVKAELRDAYPFGLLQVPLGDCVRIHASSGTRGKATIVAYTRSDLAAWADCCARALAAAGAGPGTVVHIAYGYGLFITGPSGSAAPSSRPRAGTRHVRRSCSRISVRRFAAARRATHS